MLCDHLKKISTSVAGVHATVASLCDTEMSVMMKVAGRIVYCCPSCGSMKAYNDGSTKRSEYGISRKQTQKD